MLSYRKYDHLGLRPQEVPKKKNTLKFNLMGTQCWQLLSLQGNGPYVDQIGTNLFRNRDLLGTMNESNRLHRLKLAKEHYQNKL